MLQRWQCVQYVADYNISGVCYEGVRHIATLAMRGVAHCNIGSVGVWQACTMRDIAVCAASGGVAHCSVCSK